MKVPYQNHKLYVAALGMDEKTMNTLKMVLSGPGKGDYELTESPQSAEVGLFDLDGLYASKLWQNYRTDYPHLPTIIVSLDRKDVAGTLYVKKPIEVDKLLKALIKVKQWVNNKVTPEQALGIQTKANNSATNNVHHLKLTEELIVEAEEERLHQFCGYGKDVDLKTETDIERIYYDPTQYLQDVFRKAVNVAQEIDKGGVLLEGLADPVIISAETQEIFFNVKFRDQKLHTMTRMPLAQKKLYMATLSEKEVKQYQEQHQLVGDDLQKCLWTVALLTAGGRLPKGTDLQKDVILLHWPNFTRLELTPHALEITALWAEKPHSLLDTARLLHIPQRYVFALFSAASATNLALIDRRATSRSETALPAHEKRGLFQRLLAHLRK